MKAPSGIARRLFLAFAALFIVFAAAAYFAARGLSEVHDLLHEVKRREAGVRASLELASAVRDQYAHQAHTIILGNDTHLGFYAEARDQIRARIAAMTTHLETDEERAWLADIERASTELDAIFRERIVPAVLARDSEVILSEHGRAQLLVTLIQNRADQLAARFEAAIGNFESHANIVEHATIRWSLLAFAFALALAAALGVYIASSVARPVAKLEEGAARLARGDLDTHIDLDSDDELGRLAAQFNRMTAALKEHQRHRVETEKLAGIGRLAAGVAHEINNPLAVILGYVRIMRRGADGKLAADLRIIEDEAVRCQNIVEDLLDLARAPKIEMQEVSLREICVEAIERLAEASKLPTTDVTISGSATVRGSATKLRQVIMNLIQNAAEAAGPAGRVRAEITEASPGEATIAIRDTGPGLTEEQRAHLFEPFFTTKPRGTGLGLAVSRAITNAHGGDIEARSNEGGGAVFLVKLPAASQEAR